MFLCLALAIASAEPVTSVWIQSTSAAALRPEVHSVDVRENDVIVRSAGISKLYLGELQARPASEEFVRQFVFRIPRGAPVQPSASRGALRGVFTTGVPFYRLGSTPASYRDSGLWRFDRLRGAAIPELLRNLNEDASRHSPILGYTLEGSPVYGPWGFANPDGTGGLQRMSSSYALRSPMRRRTHWPNGLELTPAQEGPPLSAEFPLGTFHEDYAFAAGSGTLDAWNGRFARTPEYPQGVYAYFLSATYPYMPTEPFTAAPLRKVDFAMADSRLEWTFRGVDGSLLTRLETAHERPLHLMAISEDLQEFAHVHPALTDHGTFAIQHRFPKPGKYFLYADFIAPGGAPRVERSVVTIVEHTKVPKLQEWNVIMKAPPDLRAGRDAELRFEMPATDLDPYLGAWAHFAIVDSKHRVFIHAHPQEVSGAVHDHAKPMGPSPVSMIVPVHFPEVGEYKVWAQFQWRGEVRVVPFSLQVREAATVGVAPEIPRDAIRVDIASEGFSPARIVSSAASVKLAFVRSAASPNCGGKVVFPDLKLEGALRPGGSWVVEVPLTAGGEIRFSCGMGMYRGAIVSRVIQ